MALPPYPALAPVPIPLPQRGQVESVFTPAMNSFIAWTPTHQQNLIDSMEWIQQTYGATAAVYTNTVTAKNETQILANTATEQINSASAAVLAEAQGYAGAAASSASVAGNHADSATQDAVDAQAAATAALNAVASLSPRLGLNIGSWKLEDGELIVAHLSTAEPSIVDGDFILTYEEIEEFA